jgi:hypothetical protein
MGDVDPIAVIRDARLCVKSREYAAALEKYMWFHDHALEARPSLVGVRLSYAIFEWVDLGKVYPPALKALEGLRDRKTESLVCGTQEMTIFHDVKAINRALGQDERTRDLFKIIADNNRDFAEKCFRLALEPLVCTNEFGLARSFMLDVRSEVDRFAMPFKSAPESTPSAPKEMVQKILVGIYVKNVSLVLQILMGVGEEVEAKRIRQYALDCVTDEKFQDLVMERLFPSPPRGSIQ